jgi:restriction system protein
VDDFVDLEALSVAAVEHPPFEPGELGVPAATLPALVYPPQPVYQEPPAPRGLIGGKKKQQEAVDRARAEYEAASRHWHEHATRMHAEYTAALERREQAEAARVAKLAAARAAYEDECRQREIDPGARNQELAKLINELAFDVESAIQQYVDIVLSNSVYPDLFPVSYEHEFSLASRELTLTLTVPPPSAVPSVREYRYIKAKDEIASTMLPVKAQKDRYANAIWQAAVRSLHEVFEADRDAKIHSIALTVGVDRISPATGHPETVPLVIVAADREAFTAFDLAKIVPRATLEHLGAALSKSPNDLTPADTSRGVRVRGQ